MTARTTTAAGSIAAGGTWTGGVVPSGSDTITINHAVTVPSGTTPIGHSPASNDATPAVTIGSGGTLTLQSGATFKCRGDISNAGSLVLSAGSIFEFDASGASSPSTSVYRNLTGFTDSGNRLTINGTLVSPCEFRSNASGANGNMQGTSNPAGGLTATYCTFTRLGTSSVNAIAWTLGGTHVVDVQNCIFDACGEVGSGGGHVGGDALVTFKNNTFKNSVASTYNLYQGFYLGSSGVGQPRYIQGNVFDKSIRFASVGKVSFDDNYVHQDILFTNGDVGPTGPFLRNFYRLLTGDRNACASMQDSFFLHDGGGTNPHFISVGTTSNDVSTEVHSGNVFQFSGTDDTGDCFLIGTPSVAKAVSLLNNIFCRNSGRTAASGTPFSALGNSNITLKFNHNTFYAGSQGCAVGETYAGTAGFLAEFYSNLGYDDAGTARGYLLQDSGSNDSVTDLVTAAHANYNNAFGLLPGSNLKGYHHLEFSSGSPGANDLNVDPQFVNFNYLLEDWDTALGGPGTISNALTELRKKNDFSGYNTAYNISALVTAIRNGAKPRNQSLKNAGQDGVDIGAVSVAAPSGPPSGLSLLGVGF